MTDVERLLRHAERQSTEKLASSRAAVEPGKIAEGVVYAHNHLAAVRGRRLELIREIADYVRELRAGAH